MNIMNFIRAFINGLFYAIVCEKDVLWSKKLMKIRRDDFFINENKLEHIKKCADSAYHDLDFDYAECETVDDFFNVICGTLGETYVIIGDSWYVVFKLSPVKWTPKN